VGLEKIVKKAVKSFLVLGLAGVLTLSQIKSSAIKTEMLRCNSYDTVAGNLYFYNDGNFSDKILRYILDRVQYNFCKAEIKFNNSVILNKNEFPDLDNSDLMFFYGNVRRGYNGKFGFEGPEHIPLKEKLKFRYNREISNANIGFVNFDSAIGEVEGKLNRKLLFFEKLRIMTQIATHEIAHGLGASHIDSLFENTKLFQPYFMGNLSPEDSQRFYPENIVQMKTFIEEAKTKKTRKQISELRGRYLMREHDLNL
jgi:hypothetical protein